jgi:hypothetical protein
MRVQFYLREPGNHHVLTSFDMDAIPRAGEHVTLSENGGTREVHSVEWITIRGAMTARVLLR